MVKGRCPYLAVPIDPGTWFATPSAENYCHKADPPQPIRMSHQNIHCLGEFGTCPVYKYEEKRWKGPLPREIQGWLPEYIQPNQPRVYLWLGIAIAIITLLVITFLIFGRAQVEPIPEPVTKHSTTYLHMN